MKRLLRYIVIALLLAILGGCIYLNSLLPIITGYAAKNLASAVFVSGREAKDVEAIDLNFSFIRFTSNTVDYENKTVTSRLLWGKSTAVYREGCGVTLLRGASADELRKQRFPMGILSEVQAGQDSISGAQLSMGDSAVAKRLAPIAKAFVSERAYHGHPFAFMALYDGKIIAERYDKDPRLAFLQTGFGHWAEYHVYGGKFIAGQTFPSKEFQAAFMRGMAEWFHDTTWSISIDAADSHYGPFQKEKDLLDLTFGNFDDSFMCEDHDGYNYECWSFFGKERYKKAPLGGEFSYYSSYDQRHCLDPGGMYGRVFEDEVAKFHMTYIIGNDQPGKQSDERITEAAMSMGYRFRIKDFRVKPGTGAAVLIANVGVAPIYRDAWVAVDGIRGSYNLRGLMPSEEQWVRIDDASISASSKPSIACDHLVKGQDIEFEADL